MNWRNELKHVITAGDRAAICANLSAVAQLDAHAGARGSYSIRSLYFDSPGDRALREKLDGVNEREKFRLRCYNGDTGVIHLEKKMKKNGLCCKLACELTADEARRILNGDTAWMPGSGRALAVELYSKMQTGLRPRTIVDYDRIPYVYGPGNVRVTIDYNIRTGLGCTDFLNPDCLTVPAGDPVILLEVKWDEYLPEIIRRAVQVKNRPAGAFSKYRLARIYG